MAKLQGMEKARNEVYNIIRDDDENDWVSTIFDTVIVLAIIVNIVMIILGTFDNISPYVEIVYPYVEMLSLIIFTIEYLLRVWTSADMFPELKPGQALVKYIFSFKAMVDLISLLSFYFSLFFMANVQVVSIVRLARIFSILKIARYSKAIATIGEVIKSKSVQLLSSFFVVFVLITFSSILMYYIEHDAQPGIFNNAFSGLWWAIGTLTTVGYGDIYPVTVFGKILGAFIAILGIGIIAIPTGIISAGFVERLKYKKKRRRLNYCPHCGKKL